MNARIPDHNPLFRPPAEADSLILQIDIGCPYNRCAFCGMYRTMRYRRRAPDEIRDLLAQEAERAPHARRIFLADGDVMRRPFEELQAILVEIARRFPDVARVNAYATGQAIASKTADQLRVLRGMRLHTLYMGLESGDETILRLAAKAETAEQMVAAGTLAQEAGLRMSVMVLLGLGGQARSHEHSRATAAALNRMQPRLLSALRVIPVPGTELQRDVQAGRFHQLSEAGIVEELREMVVGLQAHNTIFRANHSSNIVPLEARLPRDKAALIARLDELIRSGCLDRDSPGLMPLWL